MSIFRCNKGMGMVEVLIATFLAGVAVMALFSLQAPAFRATAQADYLGRAAEIMHRQLESTEAYLMNVCNSVATTGIPAIPAAGASATSTYNVITSGLGAATSGDANYTVSTTITSVTTTYFRVVVNVTWSLNATGISQTIFVARQEYFRVGC